MGLGEALIHMRFSSFSRLQLPLQLAVFLLCILPLLWAAIFLHLSRLLEQTNSHATKELHNLAHAFAEEVHSSINSIDLTLLDLREHWRGDRAEFMKLISWRQRYLENEVVFQVAVIDGKGMLVFSSIDSQVKPVDLSDREHFRVHSEDHTDKLFISKPLLGRISQRWSIQFTRPLRDERGAFAGVIVLSVAPDYFARFYDNIDLGGDSSITLLRNGGEILARSPKQDMAMGKTITGAPFLKKDGGYIPVTGIYQRASQVDGVERLFAWRFLSKGDLAVLVGRSKEEILRPYVGQRKTYVMAGAGVTVLLALFCYFLLEGVRQRARAAAVLAESEARWKAALEGAGDGVWDWDLKKGEVLLSAQAQQMLGLDTDRIASGPEFFDRLVHPDDVAGVQQCLEEHIRGLTESFSHECRVRCSDGGWKWILARGMVMSRTREGRAKRMVGTYTDTTERRDKEDLARHLAEHDALTGLPNRVLFYDRLRQAIAVAKRDRKPLAVMFIDLDKFKPVNDHFGHDMGDLLLKQVAKRLRGCLRASDTLARLGGDEFTVILPAIAAERHAVTVAENIRYALNQPFDVAGHALSISSCVGIAIYPDHGDNEAELTKNADSAMYRAKDGGRNAVLVYRPADQEQAPSQQAARGA